VRRLLFVTEVPEADVGPLASTTMGEAMKLVSQAGPEALKGFVEQARSVIEAKPFEEAAAFLKKTIESYAAGREELSAQLRDAVIAHGEATGIMVTDEQMRAYIDIVKEMVEAAFAAREKAGIERLWPVKRIAVKLGDQTAFDAATSFRKIVVNQIKAKELDLVPPTETWRGLSLKLQLDSDAIFKAYRLWARKIEILLRSQDAWKVKAGIDRGEYFVGVEGQKLRIDPAMVWFEETVPEHIAVETFPHGTVYLDTQIDEEILAEGYARELVGIIRDARNELKLPPEVWIETKIQASETMNRLLKKWKDFITQETNSQAIKFVRDALSEGYVVDCSLGQETFTVSVKPAETAAVSP
jgi:isoleucyl-tRNA synthetase